MKIDASKQGFIAKHKDKKFKTNRGFINWLNRLAKYRIIFIDKGQDCMEWAIDEHGEVLHSYMQSSVWNGMMVDLEWLKIGKNIGVMNVEKQCTQFYNFIIKKIELIKNKPYVTVVKRH
jgi:hypothetical protein